MMPDGLAFISKLAYKAAEAGRQLVHVDPRGTSQSLSLWRSRPQDTEPTLASVSRLWLVCGEGSCLSSTYRRLGLSLLGLT